MADYTIFPTGLTYSRNTKAPLMDMQVFETLALAQAYVDNADQTAYVGLTVSVVNDGDNNGLYYVNQIADADHAAGILTKVGSDSAQDIANLKAAVESLETAVGDENSGLAADVAANAASIEDKADSFEVGNGLSLAEGEINLVIDPAEGNSLNVTENGLYVAVPEVEVPEYTLDSVASPADAYAAQYEFKKDGIVLNTINIPKDQFLKSASFHDVAEEGVTAVAPYLKFVWQLDTDAATEGEQTVTYIPVADLVDTYTAGSYISITDSAISVDYESLKAQIKTDLVDGIEARVEVNEGAIEALQTSSADHDTRIGSLETAKSNLEGRVEVLEGVDHPSKADVDQLKLDVSGLQTSVSGLEASVAVIKVKDVDSTASNGVNLSLDAAGKIGINVDIDTLAAKVIEKHVVEFDADTIKTTDAVGSNEAGASVQTVLENLESRIQAAVSGGVTSVAAGNGIIVDGNTDPNNPKVSVNVVSGSSLKATADGLDLVWEQI